jgi:hypothetical protein
MKNLLLISLLSTSIIWFSCSDDDSDENGMNPTGGNNTVEYLDQDLQGQIEGENWKYEDGIVYSSPSSGDSSLTWFHIGLDDQDTSVCFFSNPDNKSFLLFTYNHPGSVLPTFEQTLSFDFTSGSTFTITMVSYEDTSSFANNRIITSGGLEITEVDTVNKIVRGRMDIQDEVAGDANNVNGNFTLSYCRF